MRIDAEQSAADNLRKTGLFPEELHCIGLAAPAGRVTPERYRAACRFLTGLGIKVISGRSVLKGDMLPYVSAPAEDRAADLNGLIRDPEVQAVYCLRGGYGSVHLLDRLDWAALKQRPLPVVGYSDITGLHAAMTAKHAGIAVSACMALALEQDSGSAAFRRNFKRAWALALRKRGTFRRISPLSSVNGSGDVQGKLFCGNLTTLASLCGTGFLPRLSGGQVIFLEDVAEPVRKLDRTLMQLKLNGFFAGCSGIVFGNFKQCGPPGEREELFRRFADAIGKPVFTGLRYGHCSRSLSLVCGEPVRIRNNALFLQDPFTAEKS